MLSAIAISAKRISILPTLLFILVAPAFAQFSSGIEGTVRDTSGALIAGAKVTLTDTRLGVGKDVITSQAGHFRIDSIASSTYLVQVDASGFKVWEQKDLVLQVGEIRTLAPTLQVGAASSQVTVSAAEASVNLTSATTGSVISETTLHETPLSGQNVFSLAALTPGMTGIGANQADNYTNEYPININAAGLRQEENGYMIDGATSNSPGRGGATSISLNPEIVQSMDVRTNDFDAQKGRNGGATVNVFTNSGSNDFHCTLDYYFLNNSLSARQEFQASIPTFQRNEMGATIGGPIIKNKLFFYAGLDVLRSSNVTSGQSTFETQDFLNYAKTHYPNDLATEVLELSPPSVYPTTGLKTVAELEAATPGYFAPPAGIPAGLEAVGTANYSYSVPKNGYQWSVRVDDYLSKTDRIYVEGIRDSDTSGGYTARPAVDDAEANHSDFINIDWTHTFSPRLLNEAGIHEIRPYGSDIGAPTMVIPYVSVTGLYGFGNWGPGNFTQTTVGWRDVMTATVKTHTLKFGFDMFNAREIGDQSGAHSRPSYTFNNLLDFIQDEATVENATPVNLITHLQSSYNRLYRDFDQGYYVQDDWKVKPRLTINAGLRYDQLGNYFDIISPALTNFNFGAGTTPNEQIANGSTSLAPNNHVLDHNIWDVTPRVGFAWDVFGAGRTSLRGGFGVYADEPAHLHFTDILSGNLPNSYSPYISVYSGQQPVFQFCSPPSGWNEVCPVVPTNNVALNANGGLEINGVIQRASLGGYSPQYKFTQVEDWTLSLQQQLRNDLIFELNYSATAAHHLPIYNQDINRFAGDLIKNQGSLNRLNPNFGDITYATSDGNSMGNFLSAVITRRTSHGLSLRGIYTWGKALDVVSNSGSEGGLTGVIPSEASAIIQSSNYAAQRGRSDFDIRQQVSMDGTWSVPGHYGNRLETSVLGGWQFAGVWILQTGLPFTVYNGAAFNPICARNTGAGGSCFDSNNVFIPGSVITGNGGGDYNADGSDYDVPNTPTFGRHLTGQAHKKFLTGVFPASAFPVPSPGAEGNLGRNTYDQPGYNNLDFTFSKVFTTPWFFGEKLRIEAKGETFNLFNRVNLNSVNSDLSNPLFGTASAQLPARRLQFHLRASF